MFDDWPSGNVYQKYIQTTTMFSSYIIELSMGHSGFHSYAKLPEGISWYIRLFARNSSAIPQNTKPPARTLCSHGLSAIFQPFSIQSKVLVTGHQPLSCCIRILLIKSPINLAKIRNSMVLFIDSHLYKFHIYIVIIWWKFLNQIWCPQQLGDFQSSSTWCFPPFPACFCHVPVWLNRNTPWQPRGLPPRIFTSQCTRLAACTCRGLPGRRLNHGALFTKQISTGWWF